MAIVRPGWWWLPLLGGTTIGALVAGLLPVIFPGT